MELNLEQYKHKNKKDNFLWDIQLNIPQKGFFLITGESGVGKSTLMKILLGIEEGKFKGTVKYSYSNESYSPLQMRLRGDFGYQPDDSSLIPWLNIKENILLPLQLNKNLKKVKENIIRSELEQIGLSSDVLGMYPEELSFGMKARVGLIRATVYKPKVIFLDELFSGVDALNSRAIVKYLNAIKNQSLIIAISHQIERVISVIDKVYLIERNSKISEKEKSYFINY